jgi:hypothetical protein
MEKASFGTACPLVFGPPAGRKSGDGGTLVSSARSADGSDDGAAIGLIPTFLVSLFTIFHVICIAQARGWKNAGACAGGTAEPAPSLAS